MVTNVWIDIIFVMDGVIALMVVMNGIGTVVCSNFTIKFCREKQAISFDVDRFL